MEATADSLPAQSRQLQGGGLPAAAEASLNTDLIGHVRVVRASATRVRASATLSAVSRAFGDRLDDKACRADSERCRIRAGRLAAAGGNLSAGVAIAYASDLFVLCTIERPWLDGEAKQVGANLAPVLGLSPESVFLQLFLGAVRASQLLDLPPRVALDTQLRLLTALAPIAETSLWVKHSNGRSVCLADTGATAQTRRFRAVASEALDGTVVASGNRGTILGAPVMRWDTPWAALVGRTRIEHREAAKVFLSEAAAAMSPVIERELVLERSAARERSLVSASERRLGRLAFDLHDGALQHIAAFGTDLFLLQRQLAGIVPEPAKPVALGRLSDLDSRMRELDRVLRELAHSLEPGSLVRRPLPRVIADEVAAFTERTEIPVEQRVTGDFGDMTVSQKIALIRVVQEALTNVREHANASHVRISIVDRADRVDARIEDDGVGFDVARTLLDAAQRGRLGLVGGSERIRLLGGSFDIRSRPGGPTMLSLSLPRWQPLSVEQSSGDGAIPVVALN